MRVRLTRDFKAVPAGRVYPRTFAAGEIVTGSIAAAAAGAGAGDEIPDDTQAETKSLAGAPENKAAAIPPAAAPAKSGSDDPPAVRGKAKSKG